MTESGDAPDGAPAAAPGTLRLSIVLEPAREFQDELGEGIRAAMAETVPAETPKRLGLKIHDADGVLVAGLTASAYWGWMFVAAVWVLPGRRGEGLGRHLMVSAEAVARSWGCHSVWLDTFQTRGFYARLGYEVFGTLEAYPGPQGRSFLRKRIAPA